VYLFSLTLADRIVRDLLIVTILATSEMATVFSTLLPVSGRVCDALYQRLGERRLRPLSSTTVIGTIILQYAGRGEEGVRTAMTIITSTMMTGMTELIVLTAVIALITTIGQDPEGGATPMPTNHGHHHLCSIPS